VRLLTYIALSLVSVPSCKMLKGICWHYDFFGREEKWAKRKESLPGAVSVRCVGEVTT